MSTYEFAKAQESSASNPDKIYYVKDAAFRDQDYRQVFHQEGIIGTFTVRLLEAADLSRRHWSALALGPIKHLGLSKAHGGVSSFVSVCLDSSTNLKHKGVAGVDDFDKKFPANDRVDDRLKFSEFVSPVVPNDDNPVWTNCEFEIPLKKGVLQDGQAVQIALRVDEDATALENIIPGMSPAGGASRLLGLGSLDVTSLCLGQNPATGRPATGVIDTWVPIRLPDEQMEDLHVSGGTVDEELFLNKAVASDDMDKKRASTSKNKQDINSVSKAMGGRVRVLITYTPHGLKPQRNDIVALEAFARQNSRNSTCLPILPPLLPMEVVEFSEPWLLVKYCVPSEIQSRAFYEYHDSAQSRDNNERKACLRIHRNAVFVIERKTVLDGALNIALRPAELILSTPLGQSACEVLGPVLIAGKQLLMPALLSSKLLWMAVRTTALAGFTGMSAAGSAFVNEGTHSLTKDTKRRHDEIRKVRYV